MKKKMKIVAIIITSIVAFWFLMKLTHFLIYDEEKHQNKYINNSSMIDSGMYVPE